MKISCLGGGGYYFLGPLGYIAANTRLRGSRVDLYDIDRERALMMADTARRFSAETGAGLDVRVGRTLAEAVDGADFVIVSIGGAGSSGVLGYYHSPLHINDCIIAAKHGVPQIVGDTCGPAAMAAAFRSVPIYLDICREMERRAPNAIMLNHANPMAVLCRAMNKYSGVRGVVGICHGVQGGIHSMAKLLGLPAEDLDVRWIGTNHYYWVMSVRHRGKDVLPKLWKRAVKGQIDPAHRMARDLSLAHGHWILYPSDDHIVEFYPFLAQMGGRRPWAYALAESYHGRYLMPFYRGRKTIKDVIAADRRMPRAKMLADYRRHLDAARPPQGEEVLHSQESSSALIADISTGSRRVHILNIPNRGSIPNLPPEAVMEVECVTDSAGVRGVYMGEAPLALEAILRKRIAWQELVADAAVKGDRKLALQAMMIDDQAVLPGPSEAMLEELLRNSRKMFPQFKF